MMKRWIDRYGYGLGFGFQLLVVFAFTVVVVLGFIVGFGPAGAWGDGDGRTDGLRNTEGLRSDEGRKNTERLKNTEGLSDSDRLYTFADEITPDPLRETLFALAHDSMAGRETGTPAEWKTVKMIAEMYRDAGIGTCSGLMEGGSGGGTLNGNSKTGLVAEGDNLIRDGGLLGGDSLMTGHRLASESDASGLSGLSGLSRFLQPYPLRALFRDSLVYEILFEEDDDGLGDGLDDGRVHGSDDEFLYARFDGESGIVRSVESARGSADFTRLFGGADVLNAPIEFAGFGIYDPAQGVRHWEKNSSEKRFVLIFDDLPDDKTRQTERMRDGALLRDPGIAGILKITTTSAAEYEEYARQSRITFQKPENIRPANEQDNGVSMRFSGYVGSVHPNMAVRLLGLSSTRELETLRSQISRDIGSFSPLQTGVSLSYQPYSRNSTFTSHNIAACIEGSDPKLRNETVVIMAHMDHIGVGSPDLYGDRVYNGADDNGSGTSALLTIAKTFQKAAEQGVRPRRSLLFLHVTGEEKGLLGSRYYSNHPVIPIDRTSTAFNIDMIGRSDSKHLQQGVTEYVYLIGGDIISSELDNMVVMANEKTSRYLLDRGYNDLNDPNQFYRRSDHWNFGRFGVPFVFFFTGVHEDYHQPGDHAEKIDFEKFAGVTKIIYGSVIEAANSDTRPAVDNQAFIEATNGRR